jgi:hypothetical protein
MARAGDFHGPSRTNDSHESTTDLDARLKGGLLVKHSLAFRSARQKRPDLLRKARG